MSRIGLQVVLGAVALVALFTGMEGMFSGALDPFYGISTTTASPAQLNLDSNLRYFNGLWLGTGFVLVALLPRVEQRGQALLVLALLIFVGGIGRVVSMIHHGLPHPGFLAATLAELLFPLVIPWQRSVAGTRRASVLTTR